MKQILLQTSFLLMIVLLVSWSGTKTDFISEGRQPQLSMDNSGVIRIVFGRTDNNFRIDSIFCTTSKDKGITFSKPVLVGTVPQMQLGMTRGPQIASSANYSIITAMGNKGNIYFFQLNHALGKWVAKGLVSDLAGSAPEGLMGAAADNNDNFYAVWLDIRKGKKNNICFSSLAAKEGKWSKNAIIYTSPDEHVCECCKPNIAVSGKQVNIMFRNWLNGSRDLYLMQSANRGNTFGPAKKLGTGTWKLKGCPMDGGGIAVNNTNTVHTVWQREGVVYYSKPNEDELQLAKGRSCSIAINTAKSNKVIVCMQDAGNVKILDVNNKKEIIVGEGSFLRSLILPDEKVFCVWEQDKLIKFKKVDLARSGDVALLQ
jgi:hypothetical protein